MFWQEPPEASLTSRPHQVELFFQLTGKTLPVDHAYALGQALQTALPWLKTEPQASVHDIHVAASGNGWWRPEDPDALLHLSKRTKLTLRLPRSYCADAQALCGQQLDILGHPLGIGTASERELTPSTTLFARYLLAHPDETEQAFLARYAAELTQHGLTVRKLLCGMGHALRLGNTEQATRSLLIAELKPDESLHLQQQVIGGGNQYGCGLFIPHKGIAPVKHESDDH